MRSLVAAFFVGFLALIFFSGNGLGGCGTTTSSPGGSGESGDSGGDSDSTSDAVANAPTGFIFTDADGNTISGTTRGATAQLRASSGETVLAFTTDGDVDFSNVTVARTSSRSVVHFPTSDDKAGLTGTLTLFVPCDSRTNQVRICPSAATTDETATGCSGELTVSTGTATSGAYTFGNASSRSGVTDCQVTANVADFGTGALSEASSGVQPLLATADFPDVSPCTDRNVLPNDADFITAINNASAVKHIHLTYGSDTDIPAICGKEGSWNPSSVTGTSRTLGTNTFGNTMHEDFFGSIYSACSGTAGICRSTFPGFGTCSASTDNGFPAAGTYRGEGCIESSGSIYLFRVRATVSGDGADKKFSEVSGNLSNQTDLVLFDSSGNRTETKAAVKAMAVANPADLSFTLRNNIDNSITYLNVRWEVICVKHDTTQSVCS